MVIDVDTEQESTKPRVYVALSGGVDSAVSAALLKEQGYKVTGAFIKTWQPDFLDCQAPVEREDARRVAAHLGIPFTTIDLEEVYRHEVAEHMIKEYRGGRTPNPDVVCNHQVKFGAFLKEAEDRGADFVATGHYAQISKKGGRFRLERGADMNKDQSYFLWTLGQDQLSKTIFPVGKYAKPHVRELAEKFKLPVAKKKDSQGVCFLGKLDMKNFLSHYIEAQPGNVLDIEGNVIGRHDGAIFYTLGQRHGFDVTVKTPSTGPLYVVARDVRENTLTVSEKATREEIDSTTSVILAREHWVNGSLPQEISAKEYGIQFRYRQPIRKANLFNSNGVTSVAFKESQVSVSPGQSLVVYDGEECLGGGVIEQTASVVSTRAISYNQN